VALVACLQEQVSLSLLEVPVVCGTLLKRTWIYQLHSNSEALGVLAEVEAVPYVVGEMSGQGEERQRQKEAAREVIGT